MTKERFDKAVKNKTAKKLLRREVESTKDVENKLNDRLSLTYSINGLSSYNDRTKVLLIGSMIPDLFYFYFGKNDRMYGSIIDPVRKTDLQRRKEHILNLCKANKIQDAETERKTFIEQLKNLNIAFLDLFECAAHLTNSYKDKDIEWYSINHQLFEHIKSNKIVKIYAASIPVAVLLVEKLGFSLNQFEYIQLYNGGISNEDLKEIIKKSK